MYREGLLIAIVLVAGCIQSQAPQGNGVDAQEFLDCVGASFSITSAEWDDNTIQIVLKNDGNRDLSGFDIVIRSDRGTISMESGTIVLKGRNETIRAVTIDEPTDVTVTSKECTLVKDSSPVL